MSDLRQQLEASIRLEAAKNALQPYVIGQCTRLTDLGYGWEDVLAYLQRRGLVGRSDKNAVKAACRRAWK